MFDIFLDTAVMADPYPLYARLIAQRPVQADDGLPVILTRYDDVHAALAHAGLSTDDRHDAMLQAMASSGSLSAGLVSMLDRRSFLHRDPPDHARLRRIASTALSGARIGRAERTAMQTAEHLIDALAARATVDIVADLAFPLPLAVIGELIGFQLPGQEDLPWWRSQMAADFEAPAVAGEDCAGYSRGAQEQMIAQFEELIALKRRKPGDDVASDLIAAEDGGELTAAEVNDTCRLLVVAAHETTTSLIANGMLALLRHPAQLTLLRDDPSLAAAAVNETARYDPPVQFTRRVAVADLEINGLAVTRGRMVLAWIAAANRDPAQFARPDEFDIRLGARDHLGFGTGIHACLGAALARGMAGAALSALCRRLAEPELISDPPAYLPNAVHAIEALPVACRRIRPAGKPQ